MKWNSGSSHERLFRWIDNSRDKREIRNVYRKGAIGLNWKEENYLHVYAPYMPHHESFIVGNKKALLALRDMIDEALQEGAAEQDFTSSDGEGYQAFVLQVSEDEATTFEALEMPYTMQYGEVNSNCFFVNETKRPNAPYSPVVLLNKK